MSSERKSVMVRFSSSVKTLAVLIVGAVALGCSGCGSGGPDTTGTGDVIAVVNGTPIPRQRFEQFLQAILKRYHDMHPTEPLTPEDAKKAQEAAWEQVLQNELIYQEALRLNVTVTEEELDKQLSALMQRFKSPEDFNNFLQANGKTPADYRNEVLRRDLTIQKTIQQELATLGPVSEEELKTAFEQNKNIPQLVRAAHILLLSGPTDTPAQVETKKHQLEEIRERILKGESFEDLAKEFSQDPQSAVNGGDVGFFTRDQMVEPFAELAFSMQVGGISEVFPTRYGFHILKKIDEKEAKEADFDEVRPQLEQALKGEKANQAIMALVKKLTQQAKVEIKGELPGLGAAPAPPAGGGPVSVDPYAPPPGGQVAPGR